MIIVEKFNYEPNGYKRSEVNQFISDVITQTESIITRCRQQGEEIDRLKNEIEHYKRMEEALKNTEVRAEEVGDNIKDVARNEAKVIVEEAKNNASRIVNEALLRAERIENNADLLEKNIKIFKRKLKIIMEQQMAVVEEIDNLELNPGDNREVEEEN